MQYWPSLILQILLSCNQRGVILSFILWFHIIRQETYGTEFKPETKATRFLLMKTNVALLFTLCINNNNNHINNINRIIIFGIYSLLDAPLSGESLGSILAFAQAASDLREAEEDVRLGKVDVSKEKELSKLLNVTMVPSLRLYLFGEQNNPVYCPGK